MYNIALQEYFIKLNSLTFGAGEMQKERQGIFQLFESTSMIIIKNQKKHERRQYYIKAHF